MPNELGELRIVKREEIVVDPSKNPRGEVVTADSVKELATSIRELGLVKPLLCTQGEKGLELVAGYRRSKACEVAEEEYVPVYVRAGGEDRDSEALAENMYTEALTEIAEARAIKRIMTRRGLSQKAFAERFGKSRTFVAERMRMLRLPEAVQEIYARGGLGVSVVPQLEAIAKVSPPAASWVAEFAASEEEAERLLRSVPVRVLQLLERRLRGERDEAGTEEDGARRPAPGDPVVFQIGSYTRIEVAELAIAAERRAELALRVAMLRGRAVDDEEVPDQAVVELGGHDVDALRALGVLLEYESDDGYHKTAFCFDSEALADRVELAIAEAEAMAATAREEEERRARESLESTGEEPGEGADPAELAARKKREDHESDLKEAREKVATARRLNLDLGRRLLKRRARKRSQKRRRELIRGLALHVVASEEHLGGLGARLVYEAWQTIEQKTLKGGGPGREKVTHLDPGEANERLHEQLVAARDEDEILDVIGDALVSATYASEEELPMSRRVSGYHGSLRHGRGAIRRAIDEEAKGGLPPELAEALRRSQESGHAESGFLQG
ncbi:MAG TPA: ParB/RepB/Spo0J family partition protein [Solirubrobacterales bacterium]|nr:ParB/RepB/Spo0J family partition protein [Solirubrobacterales bacterium]